MTEFETYEQLLRVMCWKMEDLEGKDVVNCAWVTDCSRAGQFLPVTQDYRIKKGTCPSTASQVRMVVQVNLDMTDSMGPGKLVRHMQNPSYI